MATSTPEASFFGRSINPASPDSWPFPLSRDGRPVPWSDSYARQLVDSGRAVERRVLETVPVVHFDEPGETVDVWRVVDFVCPCPDCGAQVSARDIAPGRAWFDCQCNMAWTLPAA